MEKIPAFSMMRVVEAIVIAAISSIVLSIASFFITVPTIKAEIDNLKTSQGLFNARIESELKDVNNKLWNMKNKGS